MSTTNGKREVPTPQNRGKKIALITVAVIASLALLVAGAWKLLVVPPDVSNNTTPSASTNNETQKEPQSGGTQTEQEPEPETEALNGRKQDYYTFILVGKDTGGGGNTDTLLFTSYDVPGGTMDIMSIPRDTMINVPWNIKKINAVYASSRGVEGLKTEIGHLTGVTPDFYVAIEWEAIGEIVDALGGVWFDVPYNMDYDDPYQDLYIHQQKGYRLLTGDDAMQVIRWRKNNGESYGIGDSGRQQVQQEFLKALAKQCLQIKNWTKVSSFAEIFFKNVETDIPWNNVLWFAQKAMGLKMENINFHSMPGDDQGWYYTPSLGGNLAYFFADPAGIVEMVNDHFNPFAREITEDDLQIVYKNKDASLGVTNGELADPKMAIPSVKPPSPPKPEEEESAEDGDELTLPDESGESGEPTLPGEGDEPNLPEEGESQPDAEGESQSGAGEPPTQPDEEEQSSQSGETEPSDEENTASEGSETAGTESGEGETEEPADTGENGLPPEEPATQPDDDGGNDSGEQTE